MSVWYFESRDECFLIVEESEERAREILRDSTENHPDNFELFANLPGDKEDYVCWGN